MFLRSRTRRTELRALRVREPACSIEVELEGVQQQKRSYDLGCTVGRGLATVCLAVAVHLSRSPGRPGVPAVVLLHLGDEAVEVGPPCGQVLVKQPHRRCRAATNLVRYYVLVEQVVLQNPLEEPIHAMEGNRVVAAANAAQDLLDDRRRTL
jgi:hypothetical protein